MFLIVVVLLVVMVGSDKNEEVQTENAQERSDENEDQTENGQERSNNFLIKLQKLTNLC